ncbi:MAG TPA: thaumatin family protein [Candidatus Binataceae bacterium]|nr:thaumatin family protein [Candidatus Binataceae bacterium]
MINNGASNCLATTVHADGTCACGSTQGVLECPGTASPTAAGTSDLYCSCNQDSDCGAGAACNTSSHLCFYALPSPTSFTGFAPSSPWNSELPAAGDTASFCLSHPGVTYNGNSIPAQVWWSGNVFARTGCQPDGTSCLTGDCTNHPNSSCSAGTGGNQPASLAEITMQSTATDYYDVSVINGANVGVEFGPIAGPTQAPGNVAPQYWCATPGSGCSYDFGKYATNVPLPSASNPTDYTTMLMLAESACTVGTGNPRAGQPPTGCPAFVDPQGDAYSCSGAANARNGACYKTCSSDSQCPGNLRCLQAGDGNSYCQCSAQTDCGAGQYCGTQLVPGLGSSTLSPQLYLQQCGSFEGWWTADTLCGNVNTIVGAPPPAQPALNCRAGLTDGDGKTTNIASLLECATFSSSAPGGVAGNPANASSCYNSVAGASAGCCGCATDPSNPLSDLWPSASAGCVNNNSTWASQVQPLVAILKQACPTAYSYPYDDFTSTFQCQGQGASNLVGYAITFTDLPAPTSK